MIHGISVAQDCRGKSGFEFHPALARRVAARGIITHHFTIGDERGVARACVVLEKR